MSQPVVLAVVVVALFAALLVLRARTTEHMSQSRLDDFNRATIMRAMADSRARRAAADAAAHADNLPQGGRLGQGQSIVSHGGTYRFTMHPDGNAVLYRTTPLQPVWATNTVGRGGSFLALQGDGQLVMFTAGGAKVWTSDFNPGASPAWEHVAAENRLFKLRGSSQVVRFGKGARWVYGHVDGAELCTRAAFKVGDTNDPALGARKECQVPPWSHEPYTLRVDDAGGLAVYDKDNKLHWSYR